MTSDALEASNRRIAQQKAMIAVQGSLIADLERGQHDSRGARLLLQKMKTTLVEMEQHRVALLTTATSTP